MPSTQAQTGYSRTRGTRGRRVRWVLVALGGVLVVVGLGALMTRPAAADDPTLAPPPVFDPTAPVEPGPPSSPPSPVPPVPSVPAPSDVPPIEIDPSDPAVPEPTDPGDGGGSQLPGREDDPGFFDIPGKIRQTINDWFRDLVVSALTPIIDTLAHSLLTTPDVTGQSGVREAWDTTRIAANSAYVLLVTAGGIMLMSHETLQTRYAVKDIAPRLVVGFVAINTSLSLLHEGIRFANGLALGVIGDSLDPDEISDKLDLMLIDPLGTAGIFLILMGLIAAGLSIVVLITYLFRIVLIVLLTAAAPVALACHALPNTEGMARMWWRATLGMGVIQLGQSLTLVVALRVFFTNSGHGFFGIAGSTFVNFLITCCLLYVLIRIPSWVAQVIFARPGHSTFRTIAGYAVINRAAGRLGKHLHPHQTANANRRGSGGQGSKPGGQRKSNGGAGQKKSR